jgi:hypothetical protein
VKNRVYQLEVTISAENITVLMQNQTKEKVGHDNASADKQGRTGLHPNCKLILHSLRKTAQYPEKKLS